MPSTIDPGTINPLNPTEGTALTANVRANEQATQDQFTNARDDFNAEEAARIAGDAANDAYADNAALNAETNAKVYADAGDAATLTSAQGYADTGDTATEAAANAYTDTHAATNLHVPVGGDVGDVLTKNSAADRDASFKPLPSQLANVVYTFRSSTDTSSDPGAGSMRFNAASFALTTQIAISDVDATGLNIRGLIEQATSGETIIVRDAADPSRAGNYIIAADVIPQTGFVQLDVTFVDEGTGGFLRNNQNTAIFYEQQGGGGVGGGITKGTPFIAGDLLEAESAAGAGVARTTGQQLANLATQAYADAGDAATLSSAQGYADTGDAANDAYTDAQVATRGALIGGNTWTGGQEINGWLALGTGTTLTIDVRNSNHQIASAATELTLDVELLGRGWTSLLIENDVNVITAGILVAGDFPTGTRKLAAVGTNGVDKYLVWQGALQ